MYILRIQIIEQKKDIILGSGKLVEKGGKIFGTLFNIYTLVHQHHTLQSQ